MALIFRASYHSTRMKKENEMKTMKRVFTFLLTQTIFLGQFAVAGTPSQEVVDDALNQIEYVATTEEDKSKLATVAKEISAEMIEDGVTIKQLLTSVKSRLGSEESRQEFDSLVEALQAQGASKEETAEQIVGFIHRSLPTGSSFESTADVAGAVFLFLLGAVVIHHIMEEAAEEAMEDYQEFHENYHSNNNGIYVY